MSTPYTTKEIADRRLLPVSERTLRRWIAQGKVKAVNVSMSTLPRWRVTARELARLKEAIKYARKQ